MRQTDIYELLVKILTMTFDSLTPSVYIGNDI